MVLADITGPAVINHIWLTFNDARPNWLEKYGSARPDEIVLKMYWDNGQHPGALLKGLENCAHCQEYPCERLEQILATDPSAKSRLDVLKSRLSSI